MFLLVQAVASQLKSHFDNNNLLQSRTTQDFSLNIDGSLVNTSTRIRNLGVIFDPTLTFLPHVNHVTKTAFFHLRNIARLRPSLTPSAAETLIHAFISSRLDYCNSILHGITSKTLNKLQYVQNSAARLLTSTRSRDHITPVLHHLHWLPVKQRIEFKLLTTTYKSLHDLAPTYLSALLKPHAPSRSLRSSDAGLLEVPKKIRRKTWGDRAFSVAAPTLWNALPKPIRDSPSLPTFKCALKTHLFKIAFPS